MNGTPAPFGLSLPFGKLRVFGTPAPLQTVLKP